MDLFLCGFNGFHELEELIQDQIRLDNEAVTKPLKILHQETVSKVVSTCTWSKIYISVDGEHPFVFLFKITEYCIVIFWRFYLFNFNSIKWW